MSTTTTTVLTKRKRTEKPVLANGILILTQKPYKCEYPHCNKAYTKPSRLEEHQRSHTDNRPFSCDTCSKSFLRESHLHAHSRTHLPDSHRPFVCTHDLCQKRFWTAQHLGVHLDWHNGSKPFICPEEDCTEAFAKNHQLRTHRSTVHAAPGTKPYQCLHPGCTKSFSTNQHLRTHAKVHDDKRYTCSNPACLVNGTLTFFPTWTALQHHNRTVHPPTCPHPSCNGKTFTSHKGLRGHLKLHEERAVEAELDAAVSDDEERPRKRRRGGEIGRDWKCDVEDCTKEFKSKKALTTHVNIAHLGRRDFSCEECGQTFGYKHLLQRHVAKHHAASTSEAEPDWSEGEAVVQPQPALDIDTLTGATYANSARQKLAKATALQCPYPNMHGLEQDAHPPSASTSVPCGYVFSRAYDLRRHLKSAHDVVLDKEVVRSWVSKAKLS
ncbi:Transcription factor iiia [Mycena kentingensis (nom. inval.)]|nr:Transcription factor iiia [Mycena kentingensis (nom. inval.)]